MNTRACCLGILLVSTAFQFNGELRAEPTNRSVTNEDVDVSDFLQSGDNSGHPCRNVSYGPLAGTKDWQWKSDQELKQAVECQLSKRPINRRAEINVSVNDGIATLSGTVKDRDAVRSVIVDVHGAGVREVVSKLEVEEE